MFSINKEYTGKDLNNHNFELYLLTNEEEINNGYKYQDGLNTDELPFSPGRNNIKKGFYFFSKSQLFRYEYFTNSVKYIRRVELPQDARVYFSGDMFKTNKFILGPRKEFDLKDYYDNDMFSECLKTYPSMFYCIPDSLKTKELCMLAVPYRGEMLRYVPRNLKTKRLCVLAIRNNYYAFVHTPDIYKSQEICNQVVKIDPFMIKYVPEYLKTTDMCFNAVRKYDEMLKYVPDGLKNLQMCQIAVKYNFEMLSYVPPSFKNLLK